MITPYFTINFLRLSTEMYFINVLLQITCKGPLTWCFSDSVKNGFIIKVYVTTEFTDAMFVWRDTCVTIKPITRVKKKSTLSQPLSLHVDGLRVADAVTKLFYYWTVGVPRSGLPTNLLYCRKLRRCQGKSSVRLLSRFNLTLCKHNCTQLSNSGWILLNILLFVIVDDMLLNWRDHSKSDMIHWHKISR